MPVLPVRLSIALFSIFSSFLYAMPTVPAWHFIPPAGIGVANVKDYGAKGDGETDDTEAILKAISDNIDKSRYRSNPFIWFPDGTYLVSGSIEGRAIGKPGERDAGKTWSAGWLSMLILIGETREGVVIKLKDSAPGFTDPAKPKWLIATGSESDDRNNQSGGGNRAFRHNILNMTVDVGSGNPGAIAIDFISNNRGSIDGVTIRSGKDSGKTAINLTRSWPGPAMVMDVSIEGFDHAMELGHYQYGMTFENITMRGQRKAAVVNYANVVTMRNLDFEGTVPFYVSKHNKSVITLLDSTLTYTGTDNAAALETPGLVVLRRTDFPGYGKIIDDTSKENRDLSPKSEGTARVIAYHKGFTFDTAGKTPVPLDLPVSEIPTIRPPDGAEWTDAGETGESLQAAIDSGAEYIFIRPVMQLKTTETIVLRKNVRLIMGMHGHISGSDNGKPVISLGEGGPDTVCLEHIVISGGETENPSSRTLVLRHADIGGLGDGGGFAGSGSGKTQVIDVIGRNYRIGPKHTFFARQLNAEFGSEPLFTNAGTSWIMGFKMESSSAGSKDAPLSTPSIYNLDGKLELFGGFLYTLGSNREAAPKVPAFTNKKGKVALSYRVNGRPETYYPIILRQGSLENGTDIMAGQIKDPGAVLLTDER